MWDQDHGNLPPCFKSYFRQVHTIHEHKTRQASDYKLSENVIVNTITHGKTMFKFKGPKILNLVKDLKFYKEANSKIYFRKKYKAFTIEQY